MPYQKYMKVPENPETVPVMGTTGGAGVVGGGGIDDEDVISKIIKGDGDGGGGGGGGGDGSGDGEVELTGGNIPSGNAGIPSTDSSQQLIHDTESASSISNSRQYDGRPSIAYTEWFAMFVLCFVNLINYMDRFTIAGVLTDIQQEFKMTDAEGGLLQTAFVLSYMVCAPIFGYLGDRYSRKWIMILGVTLWCGTTLLGSFMTEYTWFLTFRALVGIGEASYSTIAPTLISDLFIHDLRSKMLAMFYFAIPVGSGFGYIVGSETARALGSWRWALRVTPALGIIAVVLLYFTKEPARGQSEGSHNLESSSYKEDLKEIAKNPSFMLSTLGFTCVAFVTGALAWWGPTFILAGLKLQPGNENATLNDVSFIFGALTMVSGIIGVPLGAFLAQRLKKRHPRADPIICACGLLISAPFLLGSMLVVSVNSSAAYALIFFGEVALNLNWAIVADILLYVVVPTRRSTAEAFQILISHTFGDAGSPYLVGVISEAIKAAIRMTTQATNAMAETGSQLASTHIESLALVSENQMTNHTRIEAATTEYQIFEDTNETKFKALQYALFTTSFVEILGGVFFLLTAIYIIRDKQSAEKAVADSQISDQAVTVVRYPSTDSSTLENS